MQTHFSKEQLKIKIINRVKKFLENVSIVDSATLLVPHINYWEMS